jgi:hypothetical protein
MSIHRTCRISYSILVFCLLAGAWCAPTASATNNSVAQFRPVDPEELKMTREPAAPGAPAIILFRQVYRDDLGRVQGNEPYSSFADTRNRIPHEHDYFRIKILTEEGRKYADIEIPMDKEEGNITNIRARTIKPDGSIVDFDGKVFTKSLVKGRGMKYLAKTFTLPAVEVGSILEYFYTIDLNPDYLYDSSWILSNELFIKKGDFAFLPFASADLRYGVRWIWHNMPPGAPLAKEDPQHVIRLQVSNIPAFPTEDFMPPEDELKARVDFYYLLDAPEEDVGRFWAKVSKRLYAHMEGFIGKPKALEGAVAEIVGPNDPPEVKLQKIYARVQQVRNTSYEIRKTEQEEKREKEKAPASAEEVWKRGYGDRSDLTWLYLALVRSAGFEAYGIVASDRQKYFFDPNLMQSSKLNAHLVLIKLNGKDIFCEPGAAFTPFGLLPWPETGIQGMRLDKKELIWAPTLTPTSDMARTDRRAQLTLTDTGDLEGKLTVTYTGMEAARLRVEERHADETEHKKLLEEIVKSYIPAASEVKLTNQPDWKNPALPLAAEFDIKVPGWASGAGHHFLVTAGLFGGHEKHVFDHAERIYPIYVEYPFLDSDDISIQIPAGWQVSSLPAGWKDESGKVVSYALTAQNENGKLHLTRMVNVNFVGLEQKYYSALRRYFQEIKTTDDQQIVLDVGAARAGN